MPNQPQAPIRSRSRAMSRALTVNHSRAVNRALTVNHSRAVSAAGRG